MAHSADLSLSLPGVPPVLGLQVRRKNGTDGDHRLAVWQTGLGGTDWLRDLVESRRAASTGRGGYPDTYLIRCDDFRARLEAGLPHERATWASDPGDVLDPERWLGKTTLDPEQLKDCDPREWLLAEVWDES